MLRGRKPIELDIESLIEDYKTAGAVVLAEKYCVSPPIVRRRLKAAGVKMHPRVGDGSKPIKIDIESLKEDYKTAGIAALAEKYGVNPSTVWKRLKAAGVQTHSRRGAGRKPIELDIESLKKDYKTASAVVLAEKYSVSLPTICNRLKAAGVEMRSGPPHKLLPEQITEAAKVYGKGDIGLSPLAARYDVDTMTLRKELIAAGIKMRPVGVRPKSSFIMRKAQRQSAEANQALLSGTENSVRHHHRAFPQLKV